jgi:hypothetical protein
MADTYTEFLNLTKPEVGGSRDTWGDKYNANFQAIDTWAKSVDSNAKNAVLKDGSVAVAGQLLFTGNTGGIQLMPRDSVGSSQVVYSASGAFRVYDVAAATDILNINGATGAIVSKQFGDLKTYIDGKVAKDGTSVMTGDLKLTGATSRSPNLRWEYTGVGAWKARVIGGNRFQLADDTEQTEYFSVGTDGSVSTKQFGDLNTRIEARCNNIYNNVVVSARMAYAGDLGNDWNANGVSYNEPYSGGVIVSRMTYYNSSAGGVYLPAGFRWRFFQVNVPSQGWLTIGYV